VTMPNNGRPARILQKLSVLWYLPALGLSIGWADVGLYSTSCGTPWTRHFEFCVLWLAASVVLSLMSLGTRRGRPARRDAAIRFLATGIIPIAVTLTGDGLRGALFGLR
jgi:hypothetical protein